MPSAVRVLRGARLSKGREPKPKTGRPTMPADLGPDERAAWLEVVHQAETVPGLLTRADRGALELLARQVPLWRECMRHVREHGSSLIVRDEKGAVKFIQQTPEATLAIKLGASLKALFSEFGLTPAGRTRVQVPEAPAASDLDRFLAGGTRGA